MKDVGMRLRAERKRLGLSQQALGAMGGVAANAQGKYESGERLPKADYLVAVARGGVDVLYVLTDRLDHEVRNPDGLVSPQDVLLRDMEMAVRAFTEAMATTVGPALAGKGPVHPLQAFPAEAGPTVDDFKS